MFDSIYHKTISFNYTIENRLNIDRKISSSCIVYYVCIYNICITKVWWEKNKKYLIGTYNKSMY